MTVTRRRKSKVVKTKTGMLPSGVPSPKDDAYVFEWQEFNTCLQKALVSEVLGFDPNVLLRDAETGVSFRLPLSVAQRIVSMYLKEKTNAATEGV